jgi:seryl-tRNA(Sec) selenium transferase
MGGNIPGFQMLKDRVLKPLIVATEKVVEYYLNDEEKQIAEEKELPMETQTVSTLETNPL